MILEVLNYAATWPLTTPAHRGAIRYSVNLWSRANRCAKAWRGHEDQTKATILAAAATLKQRRTAVVLGSGLLRDVPIRELSQIFDTVVLVDLVHLASVRFRLRRQRLHNVRLIERDVSGFDAGSGVQDPEPLAFLRQVPYLDFVVSANLASQMGMAVKRRMEQTGEDWADPARELVSAHVKGMQNLPCATCLVTDISYAVIDRTGHLHEAFDLLFGVVPPYHSAQWEWPVAPLGEESGDYKIVHTVIAATNTTM
ncbi:hypothetical protein J5J10_14210 [Ciceribacter sp. L1K23]|uniref:hypothetical protein n=1 Tax=Ciceribacter sp. L1K23 TaxID=2820276 RepID=UPI001B814CF9|nr:hypothetical protein [Ciceribacter sp. L1K23]MBR0556838.1 hypothetical protein [Ciceribacter sp. L1K23]